METLRAGGALPGQFLPSMQLQEEQELLSENGGGGALPAQLPLKGPLTAWIGDPLLQGACNRQVGPFPFITMLTSGNAVLDTNIHTQACGRHRTLSPSPPRKSRRPPHDNPQRGEARKGSWVQGSSLLGSIWSNAPPSASFQAAPALKDALERWRGGPPRRGSRLPPRRQTKETALCKRHGEKLSDGVKKEASCKKIIIKEVACSHYGLVTRGSSPP